MPSGRRAADGRKCRATTKRGEPCRAVAVENGLCLAHDPKRRKEAQAARSKGAATKNKLVALEGRRRKLSTVPELVAYLSGVIQDTAAGELSVDVARTITYAVSVQMRLVEGSELAKRVQELEDSARARQLQPQGVRPWA